MLGARKFCSIHTSIDLPGRRFGRDIKSLWLCALGVLVICAALMSGVSATNPDYDCPACRGEGSVWDGLNFINFDPTKYTTTTIDAPWFTSNDPNATSTGPQDLRAEMENETESYEDLVHPDYLISAGDVSGSEVILDVGTEYSKSHIKGAVPLFWEEFLDEDDNIRPASEIGRVLGDAGISPGDRVIVYGNCPNCGGRSVATFVYWAMRYLGHDDVKYLNGGIDAWREAGLPVETTPNSRAPANYSSGPRPGYMADYGEVAGGPQLVDARDFQDFAFGKIGNAVHISYEDVLDQGRIKDGEYLTDLFVGLDKSKHVVVYSKAGAKASMVWYALQLMGYDAGIYTLNDWTAHQSSIAVELVEAHADPNPARPGLVDIYAAFQMVEGPAEPKIEEPTAEEVNANASENDTVLRTMGCVSCMPLTIYTGGNIGRSPESDSGTGGIRLGAAGSAPINAGAIIYDQAGVEVDSILLTLTSDDLYVGTWDATGKPDGLYPVILIAAPAGGITTSFEEALTVEISGTAPISKSTSTGYKKLSRY